MRQEEFHIIWKLFKQELLEYCQENENNLNSINLNKFKSIKDQKNKIDDHFIFIENLRNFIVCDPELIKELPGQYLKININSDYIFSISESTLWQEYQL